MERNLEHVWTKYCGASDEAEKETRLTTLLNVILALTRNGKISDVEFWTKNSVKITEKIFNDFGDGIKRFIDANVETESNDSFYTSYTHFNKSHHSIPNLIQSSESSDPESDESLVVNMSLNRLTLSDIDSDHDGNYRNSSVFENHPVTGWDHSELPGIYLVEDREKESLTEDQKRSQNEGNICLSLDGAYDLHRSICGSSVGSVDRDQWSFRTALSSCSPNQSSSIGTTSISEKTNFTRTSEFYGTSSNLYRDGNEFPKIIAPLDIDGLNSTEPSINVSAEMSPLPKEYKPKLASFQDYILTGNGAKILVLLNQDSSYENLAKQCELVDLLCCLVPYIIGELPENVSIPKALNISPGLIFNRLARPIVLNKAESKGIKKGSTRRKNSARANSKLQSPSGSSTDEKLDNSCRRRKSLEVVDVNNERLKVGLRLDGIPLSLINCLQAICSIVAQHLCCESQLIVDFSRHSKCVEHIVLFAVDLISKFCLNDPLLTKYEILIPGATLIISCGCRFFMESSQLETLWNTKAVEVMSRLLRNLVSLEIPKLGDPILKNTRARSVIFISSSIFYIMRTIYKVRQEDSVNCLSKVWYLLSLGVTDSVKKYFPIIQSVSEIETGELFSLSVSLIIHFKTWRSNLLHSRTCGRWRHTECYFVQLSNHHDPTFGISTTLYKNNSEQSECLISFFYQFSLSCLLSCPSATLVRSGLNELGRVGFCCCLPLSRVLSPLLDNALSLESIKHIVLFFIERSIFGQASSWCWAVHDTCDMLSLKHNKHSKSTNVSPHLNQNSIQNSYSNRYDITFYFYHILCPNNSATTTSHLSKVARLGITEVNNLLFNQLLQPIAIHVLQQYPKQETNQLNFIIGNIIECLWVLLVFCDSNRNVYELVASTHSIMSKLTLLSMDTCKISNLLRYLIYFEQINKLQTKSANHVGLSHVEEPSSRLKSYFSDLFIGDLRHLQVTWRKYFNDENMHEVHYKDRRNFSPIQRSDSPEDHLYAARGSVTLQSNEELPDCGVAYANIYDIVSPMKRKEDTAKVESTYDDAFYANLPDFLIHGKCEPIFEELVFMWENAAKIMCECAEFHCYRSQTTLSCAKYFLDAVLRHISNSRIEHINDEFMKNFSATCNLLRSLLTVILILSEDEGKKRVLDDVAVYLSRLKISSCSDLLNLVKILKDCSCIEKTWITAADLFQKCKEMIRISPSTEKSDGYELESELCDDDSSDDDITHKPAYSYIFSPSLAILSLDIVIQCEKEDSPTHHAEINENGNVNELSNATGYNQHPRASVHIESSLNYSHYFGTDGYSNIENTMKDSDQPQRNYLNTEPNADRALDHTDLKTDDCDHILHDNDLNSANIGLKVRHHREQFKANINYEPFHRDYLLVITHCLKILLSLCKVSEKICKHLHKEGFLTKLVNEFIHRLINSCPEYQEAITTLVDLWYEVAQWEANRQDLSSFLSIFKQPNPPSDVLIRTLDRLLKSFGDEPFHYVSFTEPKRRGDQAQRPLVRRKSSDALVKDLIYSLHNKYDNENLSSCLSSGAVICPVPRTIDWSPISDGFSVFAWICFHDRQTMKKRAGRYSEFFSSTPCSPFGKRNNFRYSFTSTSSSPDERLISAEDTIHILSVGHLQTIFGLWLNSNNGLLCLRISNEMTGTYAQEHHFESPRLKHIGWHSVSLSVPKHQHSNVFVMICIIIDGIEEIKLNMHLPELRNKRNPSCNLLVIGEIGKDVCKKRYVKSDYPCDIYIGNVFLFRSNLLTQETALVLHHLGINNESLFLENTSEIPFPIVIKPILLKLGVNLSILCKDLAPLIVPLKMNIVGSYLPENPHEYQCYSMQSPYFADLTSVSYPICESLEPILFGSMRASQNNNLEAAILKMGGISQLMFLAARIVELKCSEATTGRAIGLILQLVQKVFHYRCQLNSLGGFSLVFRLFKDSFVPGGVIILKEILECCISQPVICYHPRKEQYYVSAHTNGIVSDLKILEELLQNWRYFCFPKDDNADNQECTDTDGLTRLSNIGIILSTIRCLVAENSPYRTFNLVMLRKIKTLQKLLNIFEEMKVEHRCITSTCQPDLLVDTVSLLVCLDSPDTGNKSPLLTSDVDFDHSRDSFHEGDLSKCGLLKPTVDPAELKCVMRFLLLLNPDEMTYVSIEEKHAFYLSQQHLILGNAGRGSSTIGHLTDGSRIMSSKFQELYAHRGFSYQHDSQPIVEKAIEALAISPLGEDSPKKRRPTHTRRPSTTSLLSICIPEEAEWDINEPKSVLDSSADMFANVVIIPEAKPNMDCHSAIISRLLGVVGKVIAVLPIELNDTELENWCSLDLVLILCGNSCPDVRAAAVNVFSGLLGRLERDSLQLVLKRKILHLLSHQIFRHGTITESLLKACFELALRTSFDLDFGENSVTKFKDHISLKMFIPLLSLIPASTSDIVLCHNTLSALCNIIRNNEPHMLRFFYKSHCLDSLMLTLYRCVHTSDDHVSDLTGESQSEIIIGDVTEILCFFVSIFVAYPVNQAFVTFCELEAQINMLARSEIQRCGPASRCAQSLMELDGKLLETAILRLTIASLTLEDNGHSNSASGGSRSQHESGFVKVSNFCDCQCLNLLSLYLTTEIIGEDSGIESESTPIKSKSRSTISQRESQTINQLLKVFRRASDSSLTGTILADRFKFVLQKALDLMFLIAPIAKTIEKRCFDRFAVSLTQYLAMPLQFIVKAKTDIQESFLSRKYKGFLDLVWMCQDILWNHYCYMITLIISPLMIQVTREEGIEALFISQSLIQFACSYSRRLKMLLGKLATFVHEFRYYSNNLASYIITICGEVLTIMEEGGISLLPPPEKGVNVWSVVEEEKAVWLEEVQRMASFIRQKNSSHNERLRTNYANFFDDVITEGTRITMKVVELQNGRRKMALRSMKKAQCVNIRNVQAWRNIIESLAHERANWHFPETARRGWSLDETEGPNRVRRRLKRCHLKVDAKLFQQASAPLNDTSVSTLPLAFLHQDGEAEVVLSQTVESINNDENLIYMGQAALITMTVHQNGELLISGKHIYFIGGDCYSVDGAAMPGVVSKSWAAETIYEIHPRRYELRDCALEIFSTTNDSIMLAFDSPQERSKVNHILHKIYMPNLVEKMSISQATQLWRHGQITNFDYLTHLNKLSGRTLNDLMQYPVFPFVLSQYDSRSVDLADPSIYRNFSKAVSVQNPEREEGFKEHYKETEQMCRDGPYHYNSHYSNSVIVLYYMIRLPPFTELFLKFQGKKFDAPDRTFYSLWRTWQLASAESNTAMRELIPEFYYMPEFFNNSQGFNFGFRQCGQQVNHIELPEWANGDARRFVLVHRAMLESLFVTQHLPDWIDLIFGYKQTGKAAVEAVNVFHPATYFGFDVEGGGDELTINARKTMIRTYGQTPRQLFSSSHPSANTAVYQYLKTTDSEGRIFPKFKNIPLGIYVGSLGEKGVNASFCMTLPHDVSSIKVLPDGEVILLPQNTIACTFKMSRAFSVFYTISWRAADGVLRCKRQRSATILALTSFPSHSKISCCASSGKQLWCGTKSGLIFVYMINPFEGKGDLVANPPQLPLIGHSADISCLVISEEFKVVLSGGRDGSVVMWDYNKHTYVNSVTAEDNCVVSKLAISPTLGDWVSVIHHRAVSIIRYYSINAQFLGQVVTPAQVADVVFSCAPEGRSVNVFAAALRNGTVSLYSTWTMENLRIISLQNNLDPLRCLFYTPNSYQLVIVTEARRLFVCDSILVKTKPLKFIVVDPF